MAHVKRKSFLERFDWFSMFKNELENQNLAIFGGSVDHFGWKYDAFLIRAPSCTLGRCQTWNSWTDHSEIPAYIKVSKSQKHFFLKLHCLKNERNVWQNSALAS